MGMMDFSDEEEGEGDQEKAIGYLQLMPPFSERLGWSTREFKDGRCRHTGKVPASDAPLQYRASDVNLCEETASVVSAGLVYHFAALQRFGWRTNFTLKF